MDTTQARVEAALRRDATLEAIAYAAQRFLEEEAWEEVVPEVLRRLGRATGASRSYLFQNHREGDGDLRTTQRWEWVAEGIRSETDNQELQAQSWEGSGLGRWVKVLGGGNVLQGHVREFPASERRTLEGQSIVSLLEVPIMSGGEWWGHIGFDECVTEREWSQIEIDALRTAAGIVGAAIRRRRDEQHLREAETRFRDIVERTPMITYRERADEGYKVGTSIVYVSPQCERILGYPAENWWKIAGFWIQLVHPDDLERVMRESDLTTRSLEPYSQEYRMIGIDGRVVWFHDDAVVVHDETQRPVWQGVMIDITEQKKAEEQLREAESRFRALVEHIPAVTYRETLDANPEDFYISPQVETVFGHAPKEWTWTPGFWREHLHPQDRDRVVEADRHANETGEPFHQEYRLRTADSSYVWVSDQATLVTIDEGTPYWQGFMLDITERKQAEEQLEHALEVEREATRTLRALDEMKNTFLQAVSHDLRTPLAAILGLAVTLERSDLDLEVDETRDLAKRIATNARKLDRMVTDLLDLDRLARGIVEPKLHPTDVGALVRRVAGESDLTGQGRIQVDAPPIVVSIDASKVERILENLLANTARHTPAGTRVDVRVEHAEGGVIIAVEDRGPGVPADLLEAIFEPFRQGPQASPHSPGVGVGLALVARFAELQGGRAWVEEREGGGASFRVFLADGPPSGPRVGTAG